MISLEERLAAIEQDQRVYLEPDRLTVEDLDDGIALSPEENISADLVAATARALGRFLNGSPREQAFALSLKVAEALGQKNVADYLLVSITSSDDTSVINAAKLVSYEQVLKAKEKGHQPIEQIEPDRATIFNIRTLVTRYLVFFDQYGPMLKENLDFEGAYTAEVGKAEADCLSQDTLWDLTYDSQAPDQTATLRLLSLYQLGQHSQQEVFEAIQTLAIFNLRLNKVYRIAVADVPAKTMATVETEVLGYDKALTQVEELPEDYVPSAKALSLEERLKDWQGKNHRGLARGLKLLAGLAACLLAFLLAGFVYLKQTDQSGTSLAHHLTPAKLSKGASDQSSSEAVPQESSEQDQNSSEQSQDEDKSKSDDSDDQDSSDKASSRTSSEGGQTRKASKRKTAERSSRKSSQKKEASQSAPAREAAPASGSNEAPAQDPAPAPAAPEAPSPDPSPQAEAGADSAAAGEASPGETAAPAEASDSPSE